MKKITSECIYYTCHQLHLRHHYRAVSKGTLTCILFSVQQLDERTAFVLCVHILALASNNIEYASEHYLYTPKHPNDLQLSFVFRFIFTLGCFFHFAPVNIHFFVLPHILTEIC